jgi:hypothetical protein
MVTRVGRAKLNVKKYPDSSRRFSAIDLLRYAMRGRSRLCRSLHEPAVDRGPLSSTEANAWAEEVWPTENDEEEIQQRKRLERERRKLDLKRLEHIEGVQAGPPELSD